MKGKEGGGMGQSELIKEASQFIILAILAQELRHGDGPLFWRLLVWLLGWPGHAVYWLVRHRKWDTDAALI